VAAVLTLVQTKQIRINIHKRNNTKNTVQTIQNTVNTSTHITKTPTHTHTHTLQNKLKQPQYKIRPNEIVTIYPSPVLLGCEIEEHDVCGARSTHGIKEQMVRRFGRKDLRNKTTWRT
jgi:hypothetical protein